MREILNKLRNKELDILFFIMLLVSIVSLCVVVNCYDELWNFANSYKMFNGYKIYESLNVIVTPLFFYISQIFFKIFGPNYLAFRIYNIFISTTFLILVFFILKSLKVVRRRSIFYAFIVTFIFSFMITGGANYNMLAVIPVLIEILLIIKRKRNAILEGVLLFFSFMVKQTVFIYFAIGIFMYELLYRENIKKMIINLLRIYSIACIGILIFLIYMYIDNNLYNFINYCFLGINEFGTNNFGIDFSGARYIYTSLIIVMFDLFIIFNKKINENTDKAVIENIKTLLCFGAPLLLMSFPIINYYHSTLGSLVVFIGFLYIIENVLIKNLKINMVVEKVLYITIMIFIIGVFAVIIIKAVIGNKVILNNSEGPLYGSLTTKEIDKDIEIVCNYVVEQQKNGMDVKILSYKANLYMIHLNENNGVFDLPSLGNMGKGGEEELIEKIEGLQNTLILIQTDEEKIFWQESKKIRKHIINNYKKVGEISEYSVYYIESISEK